MYKQISIISFVILICSCNISENDMYGTYTSKNLINNIDTLRILNNGSYSRDLYSKIDNSLVYHNTGKWDYKNGRIILHDFLLDEDNIYSKEAGSFENVLITSNLIVKKKSGKIIIYYRQLTDFSYYEKQ